MTSTERVARGAAVLIAAATMLVTAWSAPVASIAASSIAVSSTAAAATVVPDDARESRWADEVVPQLVVGDAVWLRTPHRARVLAVYTRPTGEPKGAVLVVHGLGVHPDWALIGEIRSGLVDRGFATLSLQMPVLAADAPRELYAMLQPFAAERLDAALAWLRAAGYAHVAALSHSMGATMVDGWMSARPAVDAWVPLGMLVPFTIPPRVPVLDVVGERDYPEALARVPAPFALPADGCSRTTTIAGADHFMQGAVPRLLDAVTPFLARALAAGCAAPTVEPGPTSTRTPRPAR